MPKPKSIAIVLLSGGLDSTTCLAYAKQHNFTCYALSFAYNQKHVYELHAARKIANYFNIQHKIFNLEDINTLDTTSALTNPLIEVPSHMHIQDASIPTTYVPARNTIFLSIALAWAEAVNSHDIFIGASCIDYSGYPDCRPQYLQAFQKLANLGTKIGIAGVKKISIHAPLLYLSKAQTIMLGTQLHVDYSMTVSCYQTNSLGQACGTCESCMYRRNGFIEAKIHDPTQYYG